MGSKLHFYEKIPLYIRAFLDLKKNRVKILTMDTPQKRTAQGDRRADEEGPAVVHYVAIYSPVVDSELSNYESYRDFYLSQRYNLYWAKGPFFMRIPKISSFTHMMNHLDEQINELEAKLAMLTVKYGEQITELNLDRDNYEQRNETHMVQLCKNRVKEVRAQYFKKSQPYYVSLIMLLTQKLNKLKSAGDLLLNARTRHFRRIRYYHEKVCVLSPYSKVEIEPNYLESEVLTMLGNLETTERYNVIFRNTAEDLKQYKEDLDRMTP